MSSGEQDTQDQEPSGSICAHEPCRNVVPPKEPGRRGVQPRFCSRNCQKRAWDNVPMPCPRCGGEKNRYSDECQACYDKLRTLGRQVRDDDIVVMWNEGLSQRAIAAELGYGPDSNPPELSRLMREGRITARREGYRRRHAQREAVA